MKKSSRPSASGKSPWYYARRRFLRNYPAVAGLVWLCICVLIAIFAYPLMPDSTENGNFQVVELPKRPPGTKATMILQPVFLDQEAPGWLGFLASGKPDQFRPVVVSDRAAVTVEGDQMRYWDLRGVQHDELLPVFLLNLDKYAPEALKWQEEKGKPYLLQGDEVRYVDRKAGVTTASLQGLQTAFAEEHLVERTFVMGTDGFGRDVLSRLLLGTRVSMSVGLMAVIVSLLLGITLGAIAGFFRGWVDSVVMWFVSVVWSIPTLLLAISISFALGEGLWQLFLAIGASTWVEVARIVRGQIFSVREMQYVEATRAMGFGTFRTIVRHILPNILSPLIIIAAANFAAAILIEAGLSFLGVGVQAPAPSWGSMIKEGYTQVMFESGAWLAIFPGIAIILVVISLNLVGFGLRDALDPKYER
jgi:ABC-type dipeptide/oligopeptide/nickel transport system permease subunit